MGYKSVILFRVCKVSEIILGFGMMKPLPIINKTKAPKKGEGEYKEQKMKGLTSKMTKESFEERMNHQGNIKFLNFVLLREASQIRKGEDLLTGCLA
jgi:hypothetical protein